MAKMIVVLEGVEKFPENRKLLKLGAHKRVPTMRELLDFHDPHYHGPKRHECLLVKKRREVTVSDKHYLEIYTCLTHGLQVECLHSGWEIGWWMGTSSRSLI